MIVDQNLYVFCRFIGFKRIRRHLLLMTNKKVDRLINLKLLFLLFFVILICTTRHFAGLKLSKSTIEFYSTVRETKALRNSGLKTGKNSKSRAK